MTAGYTPGVNTLSDFMQCIMSYFDNLDPSGASKPGCASSWRIV
jgi:hypothetical protein